MHVSVPVSAVMVNAQRLGYLVVMESGKARFNSRHRNYGKRGSLDVLQNMRSLSFSKNQHTNLGKIPGTNLFLPTNHVVIPASVVAFPLLITTIVLCCSL